VSEGGSKPVKTWLWLVLGLVVGVALSFLLVVSGLLYKFVFLERVDAPQSSPEVYLSPMIPTDTPIPGGRPLTPVSQLPTITATFPPQPTLITTLPPTLTATPQYTPTPDPWIEQTLVNMSIEEKIGQMLLSGVAGYQPHQAVCSYLKSISAGGAFYRKGNVTDPEQLRNFSTGLQSCAREAGMPPLLIAMDHEGQYVHRFERGATLFPAAMARGATNDTELAYAVAQAEGQELAYAGLNMILGPVADVLVDYDSRVISMRSFGGDPAKVAEVVTSTAAGHRAAGLVPVLKHFPNHGGVGEDSHYGMPVDHAGIDQIREQYLPPYREALQALPSVVMFGHVVFPALDPSGLPATLSEPAVRLLRDELAFDGVILTDSMGMGAIKQNWSVGEASLMAVQAGVDMLLVSSDTTANAARSRLLQAVRSGELSEARIDQSVRRILTLKTQIPQGGQPPDWTGNQALAYEAGGRAVTLMRNKHELVPITRNNISVLVLTPQGDWELNQRLLEAANQLGINMQITFYPSPRDGAIQNNQMLAGLVGMSDSFDLVIVMTWEAHLNRLRYGDDWQARLVSTLIDLRRPVIVAALKSPTDLLEFPNAPTYLATFGTTSGQIDALVNVLFGRQEPLGTNPLPGLEPVGP
jgi:beta-N-acetylhexosaminidase